MNLTNNEKIMANSFGICNLLKASAMSFIGVMYEKSTIDVILMTSRAIRSSANNTPCNVIFSPKGKVYNTSPGCMNGWNIAMKNPKGKIKSTLINASFIDIPLK